MIINFVIIVVVYLLIGKAWAETWHWLAKRFYAYTIPSVNTEQLIFGKRLMMLIWPFDVVHANYHAVRRTLVRRNSDGN